MKIATEILDLYKQFGQWTLDKAEKEKRELEPRDCTFGKFIDWINYIYLNNKHNKN